jgi:glycine/D-amino acid oxidase-like deaminating enzyme
MDLTSGKLFWPTQTTPHVYETLQTSITCDVAILGGGITGALVAHYLTEAGIEAVVLEKRTIGMGSTSASTALLQYEIDTHLIDLKNQVGEPKAVRAYQLCLDAIEKMEGLTHILGNPCGFERKKSLYLASRKKDVKTIYREFVARQEMGIALEFIDGATLHNDYGFQYPAALLSEVAAQIDPFALAQCLLSRALKQGLRVFENTDIETFEEDEPARKIFLEHLAKPEAITLTTRSGFTIRAKRVIFATGYESQQYLSQNVVDLNSSYAFVSQPVGATQGSETSPTGKHDQRLSDYLIWETARPYLYMRSTSDGRMLVGGEDVAFRNPKARDALLKRKIKKLHKRFKELFPEVELEVDYAWGATFGETEDGLPFIGQTPEYPNAYFALGYGGNGITYSLIAAELLRDALLGKANPDADIFKFNR